MLENKKLSQVRKKRVVFLDIDAKSKIIYLNNYKEQWLEILQYSTHGKINREQQFCYKR